MPVFREFVPLLICFAAAPVAAPAHVRSQPTARVHDSSEMTGIFDVDQNDRENLAKMGVNAVASRDAERRTRTSALLDAGKLRTGNDFYHAAFVFQHGLTPDDYLLAHTLAVIAAARGRVDATWIAAATLDRYLQAIGQKQIYGTQYNTRNGEPLTQEPYNRTLVSDALRRALGVRPLIEQDKQRRKLQAQMDALNKK